MAERPFRLLEEPSALARYQCFSEEIYRDFLDVLRVRTDAEFEPQTGDDLLFPYFRATRARR